MEITFDKYHGTGNDFVMIDNRSLTFPKNDTKLIESMCDRRFGIGGDGLILLENDDETDFRMVYYNSDGKPGSMCGNGGRCFVAFAKSLGLVGNETTFIASDGLHHATIDAEGIISLGMKNVDSIQVFPDHIFLDTGSPHHVELVDDLENFKVKEIGAQIRYGNLYGQTGSNINFVKQNSATSFSIRTYERGVEDETYSCGTGATAVAIAMHATGKTTADCIEIRVLGGELQVGFKNKGNLYSDVFLIGPATFVFKGTIQC